MAKEFLNKWLKAVEEKNSVLCAGLDPAPFEMGRGKKGLPKGVDKFEWSVAYVKAVAPFAAALKPNTQYWKDEDDMVHLREIYKLAHDNGMIVIEDSKLADIGSTNDSGFFYAAKKRADAITISPFPGNMKEAIGMAHKYEMGAISMAMMSNPEYKQVKNSLVNISDSIENYLEEDLRNVFVPGKATNLPHVKQYQVLAQNANEYKGDAIVIGAPSAKNHIEDAEIGKIRSYVDNDMLVLLPGVGAQGGEAELIWNHFGSDRVMVNVGRSLMLADGSNTTVDRQTEVAREYRDMLNEKRAYQAAV